MTSSPLRVLVVGASSGIGAATAERFAHEGHRVAVAARTGAALQKVAAPLDALAVVADVVDSDQVRNAVDRAHAGLGGLDVVVNCAGLCVPTYLADLDDATWHSHLEINLSGTFYVAREASRHMVAAGSGSIVNVGSELSSIGMGMFVAYCSAKAGVIGLTKALAAELAPTIRVNAVLPGPVDTPMLRSEFALFTDPKAVETDAINRVPLRRFATPAEVADAIYYLGAEAAFATGTTLELDGGTTCV